MAVYRDIYGNLDMQEFENHLKAEVRKEGYIEIIMYTPDTSIQIATITSNDVSDVSNIATIGDIEKYSSTTVATLEENLWLLNGRFINYQGQQINGYMSNSVSDENGDFDTTPYVRVQLSHVSDMETFAVILNPAVPSGYPKSITTKFYNNNDILLKTVTENIEWQEDTGEVDEEDNPIYRTVLLDSLPSVNFNVNIKSDNISEKVSYIIIEFGSTRFRHRRIRVSSIMFGKTIILNQDDVLNVDYTDKTSYACDTIPSRVFKFDVNNYDSLYNIDNPDNGYVNLTTNTRIRFRNGYNVFGYEYNNDGTVKMENEHPIINYDDAHTVGTEIEWDNWKELRLIEVSANADESATFECGSILDIMEDDYTNEIYLEEPRDIKSIAEDILRFEGFDLNTIEWSSDGVPKPTYNADTGTLLPYSQWEDTSYGAYKINTPLPDVSCKQALQLLAFSVGATLLIKDNGHIKFANLDITKPTSFTNHYEWNYNDFEEIPVAEQLPSILGKSDLSDISLPKYYAKFDYSGIENTNNITINGLLLSSTVYANCKVITTIVCTSMSTETSYNDALVVGCRIKNGDPFPGNISYCEMYNRRGIIRLGGFTAGDSVEVEIIGYPINIVEVQERNVASDCLTLDTKVMNADINSYNTNGTGSVSQTELIKRKYQTWYTKKFKYNIKTRGEPLINAGDYGIIQTQFTGQMPVYILQNHWTFDGTWSGDMEVIALD